MNVGDGTTRAAPPRDADATARFYDRVWPHAGTVLRVARMLTRDEALADDLAQETMLKAFRSIDRFTDGTDARSWLLAILRNTRVDVARSRHARHAGSSLEQLGLDPPATEPTEGAVDPDDWAEPQDLLARFSDAQVIEALHALPDEIRWTLLLVDVEGMNQDEAARVLGVPEGTIKSRAHRGRKMLRDALLPLARDLRLVRK